MFLSQLMGSGFGYLVGIDGPAGLQEEVRDLGSEIQILKVGRLAAGDGECEAEAVSCAQPQGKQDLRVTMLKKGIMATLHVSASLCTHPLLFRNQLTVRKAWTFSHLVKSQNALG